MAKVTAKAYRETIETMVRSFDNDPPDNDFQRGYLAALHVVAEDVLPSKRARMKYRREQGL